jgi:hypothetical protein
MKVCKVRNYMCIDPVNTNLCEITTARNSADFYGKFQAVAKL